MIVMPDFAELSPPYRTLVADPPWPLRDSVIRAGGRRARDTHIGYTTMTLEDIAALPVAGLAAEAAHLYLWATREVFREGHAVQVARSWGFEPVSEIIWRKPNFGMGGFPRPGHEPVLICRRGRLPFTGRRDVHSVQNWRQHYDRNGGKGHSRKPPGLVDLVIEASPGPYLDLFSRTPPLGWDSWGDGYEIGALA